jgi:HEAT repeat protein/beta-lactamase regulating signal transducer with metallopeptidase domain
MIDLVAGADMVSAVLATLLIRAGAVLAVAWLLTRALRRAAAATRHAVWSAALTSLLLLPLGAAVLPRWNLPGAGGPLPVSALPPRFTSNLSSMAAGPGASGAPHVHGPVLPPSPDPSRHQPSKLVVGLVALWLLGVVAGLVRTALCLRSVRRVQRSSVPADARVHRLLAEARCRLGLRRQVRVRWTDAIEVPVNWGAVRPVILLPAQAAEWTDERLRVVLLHELAHVRRRDYLGLLVTRLAQTFYWMNPLVWIAARHSEMELERACDDEVIRAGTASIDYASHLHAIAERLAGDDVVAGALAMARPSTLRGRVAAILERTVDRAPLSGRALAGVSLVMALVALPLAGVRLMGEGRVAAEERGALLSLSLNDARWRMRAAFALGTRHARRSVPALEARLADGDPGVRGMAAWALGEIGAPRSVDPLIATLDDSDPHVREMVVLALGSLGDARAVPALSAMARDSFPGVRSVLTRALEHIGTAEAGRLLATMMTSDADEHTRHMAGYSARTVLGRQGLDALITALGDASPEIRAMAAHNLGELADARALDALAAAATRDSVPRVRGVASWALGQIGSERAAGALAVAITDREWQVRVSAADALGRTGGERAADLLIAATRDPVHQVRLTAVEALEARAR